MVIVNVMGHDRMTHRGATPVSVELEMDNLAKKNLRWKCVPKKRE